MMERACRLAPVSSCSRWLTKRNHGVPMNPTDHNVEDVLYGVRAIAKAVLTRRTAPLLGAA